MVMAASRIEKIPPYLFARLDKKKQEAQKKGVDVVDLTIGDPDLPTPEHIVRRMQEATADPRNHRYPSYEGMFEFRKAVADWYMKRFGVELNPDTEVVALIGSKEGIAHIPWAYLNDGDVALIPSPGYPVYKISTLLAGGIPFTMPLREEHDFLPVREHIPEDVRRKAKIAFLNYPNNPTGAHADDEFYERAVYEARKNDILLCHDAAYSEVTFDGHQGKSILQFDHNKRFSIEFHSLSKTYCMTGWRIGFAVGNSDAIQNLGKLKTNIDSGVFQAIQYAAIEALTGSQESVEAMRTIYARRRDIVIDGLASMGIKVRKPLGTFYIWAKVPAGFTSVEFAEKLIEEKGLCLRPGADSVTKGKAISGSPPPRAKSASRKGSRGSNP